MEDYLSKSPFGQVAGSLLRRRDSDWKTALGISLFGSVLEQMNLAKQADMQKNIERTQQEYDQIFSNNQEIWEAKAEERALWSNWNASKRRGEEAEKDWIDRQAIERYNTDSYIVEQLGPNAYERMGELTAESREKALETFQGIRDQFVNELETFKEDRAIITPTQTKFNEPAYKELQAQLDIYTDDPAKQSVILDTFGNIFGIHDRKRAELALALENAQRVRREQEATYDQVPYEKTTESRNQRIAEVVANEIGVLSDGTSAVPEGELSLPSVGLQTTEEVLAAEDREAEQEWRASQEARAEESLALSQRAEQRALENLEYTRQQRARQALLDAETDRITTRQRELTEIMQAENYGDPRENPYLEEHFVEAIHLNINPLNLPNTDAILKYNANQVTKIFGIAYQVNKYAPGEDVADYLTPEELDLYDTIMGTRKAGEELNLRERVQDPYSRYTAAEYVTSVIGDRETIPFRPTFVPGTDTIDVPREDPRRLLAFLEGDFLVGDAQTDASTEQASLFITNMLRAVEKLEKKYDMTPKEAMEEAFRLQLRGINPESSPTGVQEELGQGWLGSFWKGGKKPGEGHTWWGADPDYVANTSDYVDPDTETIISNIIPATAHRAARLMTSEKWIHRHYSYDDELGNTLSFAPGQGKSFTLERDEGEDFEVTFTSVPNILPGQTRTSWSNLPEGDRYKTYKWEAGISYIDE